MKTLILIFNFSFLIFNYSPAQQYGWVDISSNIPGSTSLSDVHVIGDEVWITSGSSYELYYSNTGGTTAFTTYTVPERFMSIHMLNSSVGYAGGYNNKIYRTADGGATWTLLFPLTGSTITSITFPPSGEPGYCCGDWGKIHRIDSTGLTPMTSGVVSNMNSITFPTASEGWVCGEGVIRHYTAASGQWNADQGVPAGTYRAIHFIDNQKGWAVGAEGAKGQIIHTTNGKNWTKQTDPDPEAGGLNAVFFTDSLNGWAGGLSGRVVHTVDGGANWNVLNIGSTDLINNMFFTSPNNGYVVGNSGQAFKFTQLSSTSEMAGAESFRLYPNPTTGKFRVQSSQFRVQSFEVVNFYGRSLFSEKTASGITEQEFDISHLPAGIYFVRIHSENQITVKKIIKL